MKIMLPLDRDDRHALAQLGGYALLLLGAAGSLVLLTLVLALCVRVFVAVAGVG